MKSVYTGRGHHHNPKPTAKRRRLRDWLDRTGCETWACVWLSRTVGLSALWVGLGWLGYSAYLVPMGSVAPNTPVYGRLYAALREKGRSKRREFLRDVTNRIAAFFDVC